MTESLDSLANSDTLPSPSSLQALVVVARRFGLHLSVHQLVRDNRLEGYDVSTIDLLKCAASVGLKGRGLRLFWDGLLGLQKALPAIVGLKDGSRMVLARTAVEDGVQRVTLIDPNAEGETVLVFDQRQFEEIWDHEVILIQRDFDLKSEEQPFSARLITTLIMRERNIVRDLIICVIMLSILALTPIMFWRLMSERVLSFRAMNTFQVLCLAMAIMVAFEAAFGALRRHLVLRLTTRVDIKLSVYAFEKVLNLPVDYFERNAAGMTMHKLSQMNKIRIFLTGQLFGSLLDGGALLVVLPFMAFVSIVMTAFVVAFCCLIFIWVAILLPSYRRQAAVTEKAEAESSAFMSQTIQGIKTIKSLALESRQRSEWDVMTAQIAHHHFKLGGISSMIQTGILPLERLMVGGAVALGVYMIIVQKNNDLTVTAMFAFVMLTQRLTQPLIQLSQLLQQFDEARLAVEVVGELVNQPPEEGRTGRGTRKTLKGRVEFSKVRFAYVGSTQPALRDVTFDVPRGTTLGVMGRSGSGKTTITRLLQRLHSDYLGLIKIDGVDVREYDLDHLRSSLGVVLQENFLFSGTIRDNITAAKSDATLDEIVYAARLAGAEEFIDKLPQGYDTYIYEGSPNLSGGQKQRIAIARALITDPKILIFDEATSALDAESEAIINANIERISAGRTVITISHRLSSLVKADAIMVLDRGEVNDIGTHDELLSRNEIYGGLWYTQNPHASSAAPNRPKLTYRGPNSVA